MEERQDFWKEATASATSKNERYQRWKTEWKKEVPYRRASSVLDVQESV